VRDKEIFVGIIRTDGSMRSKMQPSRSFRGASAFLAIVACALAFCLVVVALCLPSQEADQVGHQSSNSAQISDASSETQDSSPAVSTTSNAISKASAASAESDGEEAESIEDEENPMSSGLEGGEPASGGFSFAPVAIVGILAVALFFAVIMRRMNGSIRDLKGMFK